MLEGEDSRENKIPMHLKEYERYMKDGELSVLDGVIFHGNRILVPRDLRCEVSRYSTRHTRELRGCSM